MPKVSVRSARATSPGVSPVDASMPLGTSSATTVAPRWRAVSHAPTARAISPRGAPVAPVPSKPSTTTVSPPATRLIERDDRALAELVDRERAFGAGVGRGRGDGFDDANANAGRVQRARDDPCVAAVVSGAGEDQDAGVEPIHGIGALISAAAAAPARCMSARDGTPALIVEESRAADSALVTTRTRARTVR